MLLTQEKQQKMTELAQENLSIAQARQWYDKHARLCEFKPGNLALFLLQTSCTMAKSTLGGQENG